MQFTRTNIRSLVLPEGKTDFVFWDDDLPCFGLRIRGDTRRFIVQYRVAGRSHRESLGDPRKVSLEDARRAARAIFAKVEIGMDPAADRAKARAQALADQLTLAIVSERYLAARKPAMRPSTFGAVARHLRKHWEPLKHRPVEAIRRADVAARLGGIATDKGRVAASRARASLSAMYTWALREGLCENNPVNATNDPGENIRPRERVLTDRELRIVWQACGDDDFGRIVRLLILTGCRRNEIGSLRWEEIDTSTGKLSIPGTRTKNHAALRLTLPPAALALLPPRRGNREHIFGRRGFRGWAIPTTALRNRIVTTEGRELARWTLHDLRRTARTGMGGLGVPPHIAELVLNHARPGMNAVYDKHTYQGEIATALARWADHVMAIVEGDNVVPLARPA